MRRGHEGRDGVQGVRSEQGLGASLSAPRLLIAFLFCLATLAMIDDSARDGFSGLGEGGAATVSGRALGLISDEPFERGPKSLLQDAELVYGPTAAGFDTATFLARQPGLLAGSPEADAAAIDGVALRHSIDPRLLIALLSMPGSNSGPGSVDQAATVAIWLSDGYYGLKHRGEADLIFSSGQRRRGPVEGGAAHFALARYLARLGAESGQEARQQQFAETYARLFDPAPSLATPVQPGVEQPPLLLPWSEGQRWHYTGGPHGAWGVASAWGAVDFAPPSLVGCGVAPEWVLAAAPGVVTWSDTGLVLVDLDADGNTGTGWVLAYLHMATVDKVAVGTSLEAGDRIGRPSCEGGVADGAHLHFARRYNGEWLPASGGPLPMSLSGWTFQSLGGEYDGSMLHAEQGERMAVTSRRAGGTDVISDNGPTRRAELASAWNALRQDSPVLAPSSPGLAASPSTSPPPILYPTAASPVAASDGATLALHLALEGRVDASTPVVIGLSRGNTPPLVLMAHTDAAGMTGPINLPPDLSGVFDLTLRVPGYAPAHAIGIEIGGAAVSLDLSSGGHLRLVSGEMNSDDVVDGRDVWAWLGHWRAGRDLADVDGDGSAGADDLWRVLRNASRD